MKKTFHSNGKLLLTAEYAVLDGALALAIPTRFGQSLEVSPTANKGIHWKSLDEKGGVWFEANFEIKEERIISENTSDKIVGQLLEILQHTKKLNPEFLNDGLGFNVKTYLDFPRNWGLGSSSTLINNIAQWAKVDPFALLGMGFGGSGYDIAAAQHDVPILFQLKKGKPLIEPVSLSWDFTEKLFFVHLNKKQDSKEGIARYKINPASVSQIEKISEITKEITKCTTLKSFEELLNLHEEIISSIIGLPTIKENLFNDYPCAIKSLGAWGGDFVLATGNENDREYFKEKGFETIIPFAEMIK